MLSYCDVGLNDPYTADASNAHDRAGAVSEDFVHCASVTLHIIVFNEGLDRSSEAAAVHSGHFVFA